MAEDGNADSAVAVDRYGFTRDADEGKGVTVLTRKQKKAAVATLRRREGKWRKMLSAWNIYSQHPRWRKVVERCRKGIPDSMRAKAWLFLTNAHERKEAEEKTCSLADLIAVQVTAESPVYAFLDVIERDLHRTYPDHEMFLERNGIGQSEMRDVLRAYAVYDQELGYCQGMGMIAGFLLMHMPIDDAFWTFTEIIRNEKYMKDMFTSGLRQVQVCTTAMDILLQQQMPQLAQHIEQQGLSAIIYMTDWFMCAYSKTLPWDAVLRIWDMFLCEGRVVCTQCYCSTAAWQVVSKNEACCLFEVQLTVCFTFGSGFVSNCHGHLVHTPTCFIA
eukprot:m.242462 g.242462  ORF g.242462 m.242462 type:complete len:331 (-) comp17135_c12_seq4:393-1385(-)